MTRDTDITTLNDIEDEDVREALRQGLQYRVEALEFESRAKELRAAANELLKPALISTDTMKVQCPGLGSATFIITERKTLNKDVFKNTLVQKGVSALVIATAETAATTVKSSESVRFTLWKDGE